MSVNEMKIKAYNQNLFLMLLKKIKIEEAIEMFVKDNVEINCKGKNRLVLKKIWIRFLKRNLLNQFHNVVQFNVEILSEPNENMIFKIFMICKKYNSTLEFTEIRVVNTWKENYINKTQYELISY